MGLFKKVKKGIGKVVDGVTKVIDKVTGIDLKKILANKWVSRGLLAASLVVGGIAIANGVMQGYTAASAANGFMAKFVEGSAGFIQGAAAGLANPLDTGSQLMGSAAESLGLGATAPGAISGAGDAAASLSGSAGQDALVTAAAAPGPAPAALNMGSLTDPGMSSSAFDMSMGGADANVFTGGGGFSPGTIPGAGMGQAGGDALGTQLADGAAEGGFFSKMAKGAGDFLSSPTGMMTAANAAQGWAQGSAIEERWEQMNDREDNRRKSWENFGAPEPLNVPSLTDLRKRGQGIQRRGNQAQAKYGYGR